MVSEASDAAAAVDMLREIELEVLYDKEPENELNCPFCHERGKLTLKNKKINRRNK